VKGRRGEGARKSEKCVASATKNNYCRDDCLSGENLKWIFPLQTVISKKKTIRFFEFFQFIEYFWISSPHPFILKILFKYTQQRNQFHITRKQTILGYHLHPTFEFLHQLHIIHNVVQMGTEGKQHFV